MKDKKVYLTIAYMFIVLAMTLVIANTQSLAIESNTEGNNVLNTNVSTDKTTFKAKVKYKKFPLFDENNPVIRKGVLVGLTKNGVDLGKKYEKFVSTRFDEVELNWDNLDKYTVQNGEKKENVYEIKLKSDDINERFYDVEVKSNEIIITSRQDLTDYTAIIKFKDFDKNEIKPNFKVELYSIKYRPVEEMKKMGEKYDREVNPGKEEELRLHWEDLPNVDHYGVRIKNLDALDKEKYKVVNLESEIVVIKNKEEKEAADESVEIKDLNLKKILIDIINKNNKEKPNYDYLTYKEKTIDSKIYKKELEEIKNLGTINTDSYYWRTSIDLREVKSLEGIENLINLEEMNVNVRDEKQLLELSKLKTIKKLQLETKGDNLDTESLKGFTNLEKLQLFLEEGFGNLKDLNFLNDMKKLVSLKILNADIKNLDAIKDSSIKELYLDVKNIPSVTPITENQNIENLTIKLPNSKHKFKNEDSDKKYKVNIDALVQQLSYYYYNKEISREKALKFIESGFEGDIESFKKYIEEEFKEIDNGYKINNLKEIVKMTKLKNLTLNGVKLENIDGISNLKNLEYLDISWNFVSNLNELLSMNTIKELEIKGLPIYDLRISGKLKEKINKVKIQETSYDKYFDFIINPKKFTLPDIYNKNGEKIDILELGSVNIVNYAGEVYTARFNELFKDVKNFIKKNEDGTYSYIYKPYDPLQLSFRNNDGTEINIRLYPVNKDYNDQDLNNDVISKKEELDKSKIVKFKNESLKEAILKELKTNSTSYYEKDEKENEIYENELKYIEKLIINFEDTEDLSELKMLPNLKELEINSEIKDLEVLKELDNLRSLKINKLKKGQHLPEFKENNKIWYLYIDSDELKEKEDIESLKNDIVKNNLKSIKTLIVPNFDKISLNGLEDLENLTKYRDSKIAIDSYNYMGHILGKTNDLRYNSNELNITYKNNKVVTDKSISLVYKNSEEEIEIIPILKPNSKKFRINILDKVNNKNIEIDDPDLKKNEDGTYEFVTYANKVKEITVNIDGKKVKFKIDTTGMPLEETEEAERKEEEKVYYKEDLERIIKENSYDVDSDENLTPEEREEYKRNSELEFAKVKSVIFSSKNQADYEILRKFPNIKWLTITLGNSYGEIPNKLDLSVLKELKGLKKLDLTDFILKGNTLDLANIEGMESLEELKIKASNDYEYREEGEVRYRVKEEDRNKVENVEKIATLKNLKVLNLSKIKLENIDFLSNLTKLQVLDLVGDNISNINSLNNLNELKVLKLTDNNISNIDSLKNKFKLIRLYLQANNIKDINPLEKSTKLEEFDISVNDVEDINVLRNFKNLKYLGISNNPRIKSLNGLKETLKENMNPIISLYIGNNSISDSEILEVAGINERLEMVTTNSNTFVLKPKTNKFDIDLYRDGKKMKLSDSPLFRYSGLIKNEDGTYSFKDYKNSEIVRLNVGRIPAMVNKNYYLESTYSTPYYYVYIDPSEIREEDKVIPIPEKEEEPKEEKKVEEKISEIHEKPELIIPQAKLPYAGMQDDSMLKVALVLVGMYTIASFNLYKKGLEKKNNNK